jgi:hypothetical protein
MRRWGIGLDSRECSRCLRGDPRITSIAQGTEVYSFKAVIENAKTTGLGACGGCEVGACILLNSIKLNQAPPNNGYYISTPAQRQFVTWQCPGEVVITDHGGTFCNLDCPTPARARTWGQIKQLFR